MKLLAPLLVLLLLAGCATNRPAAPSVTVINRPARPAPVVVPVRHIPPGQINRLGKGWRR